MKSLLLSCLFIPSAFAVTMDDLVGTFKSTSTDIPIRTILTVRKVSDTTATVNFDVKKSPYGRQSCRGESVLDERDILTTETVCKSGLRYRHIADFSPVGNFERFSIQVHNTLYDETITMLFERR